VRVVIAGASGFLGTHLTEALRERDHDVVALVRREADGPGESSWDPYAGRIDADTVESADVVVNLAGSPTAGNVHASRWARELRESRVRTTATLADAIAASERKPAFLAGNGIAFYGDHGDQVVTEETESTDDTFMSGVARDWQAAADPAVEAGARVCWLRTSPVMDRRSPPLKQLRLLFKLALGGRLGDGEQYMPMLSLRDWLGGVTHLAEHDTAAGPFNLVCPHPPTNREFTQELARQLGRPAFAFAPAALVRAGAGKLAPELLGSVNARPAALEAAGYEFRHRDVVAVLRAGLSGAA
jgi:uncharacterized protein (TIGR01777 family)